MRKQFAKFVEFSVDEMHQISHTVQKIIKKFEETGSIMNSKTHARTHAIMRKCHREFRQKRKSVPAESWGTFVGYCVPQLIAVCVLYIEIKISTLLNR